MVARAGVRSQLELARRNQLLTSVAAIKDRRRIHRAAVLAGRGSMRWMGADRMLRHVRHTLTVDLKVGLVDGWGQRSGYGSLSARMSRHTRCNCRR